MINAGYKRVETFLSQAIGLDAESVGAKSIAGAVDALMETTGMESVDDYLEALESGRESVEELIEKVVIPETWFFRDRESFHCLRTYVEEKSVQGCEKETLRILSAPCSTGEEPYSIAMALLDAGLAPERFRIDAVDISARAIDTAKKAVYGKGSFREKGRERYERFLARIEHGFRVVPDVTGLIHFYRDNLTRPHALEDHACYDIVFCKNLFIYLTANARRTVIENLDRLLVPHGLLFVGNSEVVSLLQQGYRPVRHARSFACEKVGPRSQHEPALPPASPRKPGVRAAAGQIPMPEKREEAPQTEQPLPGPASLEEIRALADRGALHEALPLCRQFLGEHPNHKEGYCLMGLIHFALNSLPAAEEYFRKVLYLDPHHYETLVHMGLLYEKRGDQAKAALMKDRIERFLVRESNGRETL